LGASMAVVWRRMAFVACLCLLVSLYGAGAQATVLDNYVKEQPPPRITADAALLMDWETGRVIYEQGGFDRRPPASTTKIVTAILAIEMGNLDDVVEVSRRSAVTPGSTMNLRMGQRYTLRELLWGLLLRSGNDAAVAISEHVGGSVEAFAEIMTAKALEIGAVNTSFKNPHGLHNSGHYTTAYDLALFARYALEIPLFADIVDTRATELERDIGSGSLLLKNTNKLLWSFEGADGVKTGTTSLAGRCLVASATRNGHRLLAVVLHSDNRYRDAAGLLNYGFDNFTVVSFADRDEHMATVRVRRGMVKRVKLIAPYDITMVVPISVAAHLRTEITFPVAGVTSAPIEDNQVIGLLGVYTGEELVGSFPLVAAEGVERWTPLRALWQWLTRLFAHW